MFDRLAEVQRLLAEEFADSTAGGSRLSDPELVERVEAAQRVANMAFAVQAVRMAQYAAREDVFLEDGTVGQRDRPLGHVSEFAAGVVGPALGLSPAGADAKVRVAARLAGVMRGTLGAVAVGDLDEWRATVLVRELRDASPEVIAAVEEAVLPKAVRETAGQVRNRARRELAKVDPEVLAERVRRCREERGLWRRPGEPGVSEWLAVLPNETSAACWAAVDELARRYRADGDARTLDQARADAMADLVLGNATVTTTLTIAVPVIPDRMGLGLPRSPGERATGDEVPAPGQPSGPTGRRRCASTQTQNGRAVWLTRTRRSRSREWGWCPGTCWRSSRRPSGRGRCWRCANGSPGPGPPRPARPTGRRGGCATWSGPGTAPAGSSGAPSRRPAATSTTSCRGHTGRQTRPTWRACAVTTTG